MTNVVTDVVTNVILTTPAVNAALKQAGAKEYLVKGKGMFFFAGGSSAKWPSCKVEVDNLNKLTMDEWVSKWKELSSPPAQSQAPVEQVVEQPAPVVRHRRTTIREGAVVRLKPEVAKVVRCPDGRENNRQAKVLCLLKGMEGVAYMDRDLRGCRSWSVDELEVLSE